MTILRAFKWAAALLLALQAFELGVASHLRAPQLWGFTTASYFFGSVPILLHLTFAAAAIFVLRLKDAPDPAGHPSPSRGVKKQATKKKGRTPAPVARVARPWLSLLAGCAVAGAAFWLF